MTAPSTGSRIDLGTLTDQLRILPTLSWTGVQESMRLLRDRSPEERRSTTLQDHVKSVDAFASMIRDHAELIAYSLACGVALARVTTVSPTSAQVLAALQTVSRAYNFSALGPADVRQRIVALWNALPWYESGNSFASQLAEAVDAAAASLTGPPTEAPDASFVPKVETSADVQGYFTTLGQIIESRRSAAVDMKRLLVGAQLDAWQSRLTRYEELLQGRVEPPPSPAEVICGYADNLPGAKLGFSLRDATAVEWTRVLLPDEKANTPQERPDSEMAVATPAWVDLLATHALGFRIFDEETAMKFVAARPADRGTQSTPAEKALETFFERYPFLVGDLGVMRALFVVRRDTDSMVERWPTAPEDAVLSMTEYQATTLLARLRKAELTLGSLLFGVSVGKTEVVVAVEQGPTRETNASAERVAAEYLEAARKANRNGIVRKVAFGTPGSATTDQSTDAFVLRPERYEDLLAPHGIQSARYQPGSSSRSS